MNKQNDIYIPEIKFLSNIETANKEKGITEHSALIFYFQDKEQYNIYLNCDKIGEVIFFHTMDFFDTMNYDVLLEKDYSGYQDFIEEVFNTYFENVLQQENTIKIGYPVKLGTDHMRADYMDLMLQAEILMAVKTNKDTNYAYTQYERVARWLQTKDFFTAPASTRFHESEEGGLLKHSLTVYNYICDLKNTDTFKDVDVAEMTICALTHDWCKINRYEKYMRNVKDEATGQWHQEASYKTKKLDSGYPYPFGHGETSSYIVNQFFRNLSMDASLAIRWHMNSYYTHQSLYDDLYDAKVYHPLVLMLITADELSLTHY